MATPKWMLGVGVVAVGGLVVMHLYDRRHQIKNWIGYKKALRRSKKATAEYRKRLAMVPKGERWCVTGYTEPKGHPNRSEGAGGGPFVTRADAEKAAKGFYLSPFYNEIEHC